MWNKNQSLGMQRNQKWSLGSSLLGAAVGLIVVPMYFSGDARTWAFIGIVLAFWIIVGLGGYSATGGSRTARRQRIAEGEEP